MPIKYFLILHIIEYTLLEIYLANSPPAWKFKEKRKRARKRPLKEGQAGACADGRCTAGCCLLQKGEQSLHFLGKMLEFAASFIAESWKTLFATELH